MERKICTVDGCNSGVLAKGLCEKHYDRMRRTGSTELSRKTKDDLCVDCGKRYAKYKEGGGTCQACYRKRRKPATFAQGVCVVCGEEFVSQRRYTETSGRGMYCSRACKEVARRDSGRASASSSKWRFMAKYGLTGDQVDQMRSSGCAICGSAGTTGRWGNLHIDHDHTTGKVRGALCHDCNVGLGHYRSDPALLRRAADYLESPPGPPAA